MFVAFCCVAFCFAFLFCVFSVLLFCVSLSVVPLSLLLCQTGVVAVFLCTRLCTRGSEVILCNIGAEGSICFAEQLSVPN